MKQNSSLEVKGFSVAKEKHRKGSSQKGQANYGTHVCLKIPDSTGCLMIFNQRGKICTEDIYSGILEAEI